MSARSTLLLLLAIGAIACAIVLAATPDLELPEYSEPVRVPEVDGGETVLRIGSVSVEPREETARYRGFSDALAARLPMVDSAEIVVMPDVRAMANALAQGAVDVYIDSPLPIALAHRTTPMAPLVVRHKGGQREYASVVFSRVDGDVRTLQDLPGHRVVFTEPFSTSGFMLPATLLRDRGLDLCELPPEALPGEDGVSYGFSRDDETSVVWVLEGRASAAALGELDFERLAGAQRAELRVLARTATLPRQLVCSRSDLDPELQHAIRDALLTMSDDPALRGCLMEFGRTTGFSMLRTGEFEFVIATASHVEEMLGR